MRSQPVDPLSPRWDLGIIPCTSGKHADGVTPLTLYKGGPFATMIRHAQQRCDHVLIMSAKFGLLRLDDPVSYYDAYLPKLPPQMRERLRERTAGQLAENIPQALRKPWNERRVLSYLPEAYHDFLMVVAAESYKHVFRRPYAHLGMLTMIATLSAEIACYGSSPSRR